MFQKEMVASRWNRRSFLLPGVPCWNEDWGEVMDRRAGPSVNWCTPPHPPKKTMHKHLHNTKIQQKVVIWKNMRWELENLWCEAIFQSQIKDSTKLESKLLGHFLKPSGAVGPTFRIEIGTLNVTLSPSRSVSRPKRLRRNPVSQTLAMKRYMW